jgi:hypothetical protein
MEGGAASAGKQKEILVKSITISGPTLTAVEYLSIVARKFSTAAAGGTATDLTKVPLDATFPTAQLGTLKVYTAAPTDGTLVGVIAARRILGQATVAAAGGQPDIVTFDFSDLDGGGVILRGAAQGLGLAFSSAPATAVTLSLDVAWDEI